MSSRYSTAAPRPIAPSMLGRPRFELPREILRQEPSLAHLLVHGPSPQEGLHLVQEFAPSEEHPDSGRSQHLVAAEDEKVAPEGPDIGRHVRNRLGTVDQNEGAGFSCQSIASSTGRLHQGHWRHREGRPVPAWPKSLSAGQEFSESRLFRHPRTGESAAPATATEPSDDRRR